MWNSKAKTVCLWLVIVVLSQLAEGRRVSGGRRPTGTGSRGTHGHPASLSYPNWRPASRTTHQPFRPPQPTRPPPVWNHASIGAVGPPAPNNHQNINPASIGFKDANHGPVVNGHMVPPNERAQQVKPLNSGKNPSFEPSAPPFEHGTHSNPAPPIGFKATGRNDGTPATHMKGAGTPNENLQHVKPLENGRNRNYEPSAPPAEPASRFHPAPPIGFKGSAPYVAPPPYTPHHAAVAPPAYSPAQNPAGYGPPPAYHPYSNGGAPYPQQQYHQPGYPYPNSPHYGSGGMTNIHVTNINTNNHHYNEGYGGGFGGFGGYSYPSYHYSSNDLGSGTLGFFLGYSLAKITTPTFHHHSFYDGYTPRYDHYEIHHYYHNSGTVPAQSTIQPNAIVGCVGDSGSICPQGTSSLCTNNGAILCVASAASTVPCTDAAQGNCVRTVMPCVNGTQDCTVGSNTTLAIPCISKAQVPGNVTYVNNTVIVNHTTIINNFANGTSLNETVTSANSTSGNTVNGTAVELSVLNITTPVNGTEPNANTTRSRRDTPAQPVNEFCVTILALPAEKKPSTQEQLLEKSTNVFAKFFVRALGAN
ncbi:uncharacterized protein LOC109534289 isoform X1 [Dendroctonus ponderosae]|uniref:uncharacterized protein LOC109534289 isoform X1 n=1 Tax=Dendroctonus ponderosae TaxID=77166 RepID=UPI0020363A64|nr:uncharacterized protein LOC109534289 isoform X1 [Dendroctonus ponderosae]KAH1010390.1 hypothetical protein HUJ05_004693 [Dendroctonus ponderosae]